MHYYDIKKKAVADIEAMHREGKAARDIEAHVLKEYGLGPRIVDLTLSYQGVSDPTGDTIVLPKPKKKSKSE